MTYLIPVLKRKIFPGCAGRRMLVLTLAAIGIALAPLAAEASHGTSGADQEPRHGGRNIPARIADNAAVDGPAVTSSLQVRSSVDGPPNCDRSRRRLFVEGEGWIVRRVTTCY